MPLHDPMSRRLYEEENDDAKPQIERERLEAAKESCCGGSGGCCGDQNN
jgi:hypothetical protein